MHAPSRDLRIDFFRGLALLIVVVDHVEGWSARSLLDQWTLVSLGFSDAAEIFVFLSGLVFGRVYLRTLESRGWQHCLWKAAKRAFQIYLAYLLASATVIGIGVLAGETAPTFDSQYRVGQLPWESMVAALALRFHPFGFDILAFYVLVLPVMALLLVVKQRANWLAWTLTSLGYFLAQTDLPMGLTRFADGARWYFDPRAWQFLFFIGMALGTARETVRSNLWQRFWMAVSLALIAVGLFEMKFVLRLINYFGPWNRELAMSLARFDTICMAFADKTSLGPLRLAHFLALVYVCSRAFPKNLRFWSSRGAGPLVVCGQHSLEVYAFGLVASFLAVLALGRTQGAGAVLLVDAVTCAASIAFAYGLRWWKMPARRAVPAPVAIGSGIKPHTRKRSPAERQRR